MKENKIIFGILFISFIALEVYCAEISYFNYGWLMPPFLYLLIVFNLLSIILFIKKKHAFAIISAFVLAIAIVPLQLYQSHKYQLEREEGADIANYVYQQKLLTGHFPENLNNYKFKYPALKKDFSYSKNIKNEFSIIFTLGTSSAHYYHHPSDGKWKFYDD